MVLLEWTVFKNHFQLVAGRIWADLGEFSDRRGNIFHWSHAFDCQGHAGDGSHALTIVFLHAYICVSWHLTVTKGWFTDIASLGVLLCMLLVSNSKRSTEITEGKLLLANMKHWYDLTVGRLLHCDSTSVLVRNKCFIKAFTAWSSRAMDLPLVRAARPNNADSTGHFFWCVERDSQLRRSKACNVLIFHLWVLRLLKR